MLRRGVRPDAHVAYDGTTALAVALRSAHFLPAQLLLKHGASVAGLRTATRDFLLCV